MKQLIVALLSIVFIITSTSTSNAQTGKLLGGNVVNGAITGTVLGAATMGLKNDSDLTPLRIGLGSGILAGAGIALYDVATVPSGQEFFISGIFNDGNNTSIIILLDTMYGTAGGALLGTAVMLIGNQPIVDGLQYGASIGAWAGFGIGLLDGFVFAERNNDFISSQFLKKDSLIEFSARGIDVGMVQPQLFSYSHFSNNALSIEVEPALQLFSLNKRF